MRKALLVTLLAVAALAVPAAAGLPRAGTLVPGRSLGGEARSELVPLRRPAVVRDDLGAAAARGVELGRRSVLRHDDRGVRADERCGDRHGLRMVTGRVGEDAAPERILVEGGDLVVGAAELERAAALEALRLDVDAGADVRVEHA